MNAQDLKQLENIRYLTLEILDIENKIAHARNRRVVIFYKDYTRGYARPRTIDEIIEEHEEKTELEIKRDRKLKQLQKDLYRAIDIITSEQDAGTRAILEGLYIAGLKRKELANILNVDTSTISKKIKQMRG